MVAAASLDSAERRTLFQGASPRLTPTGHVVATRDASLWVAPFDAATLTIGSEPVPVLEGVQIALSGEAGFVVTADGTLMYLIRPEQNLRLSWFGRDGTVDPVVDEVFSGVLHPAPELSPDGKQLVITVHPQGDETPSALRSRAGDPAGAGPTRTRRYQVPGLDAQRAE